MRALIHPGDIDDVRDGITESARTLAPWRSEFRYAHPQKGEVWIECHFVPQREGDGSTVWHGIVTDITERKRAGKEIRRRAEELATLNALGRTISRSLSLGEVVSASIDDILRVAAADLERRVARRTAELEAKNRELESFSYSLSHDLRAPLRAISGFAEIIARRHSSDLNEQGRHYFDNIVAASERMGRLIDDLLAYSRLGRQAVSRSPVSLDDVLAKAVGDSASRAAESRATITIAPNLPVVYGNSSLLQQVFVNLLDNALTYHRPDVPPRIRVTCQAEGGRVTVRVADNGLGILPEYHEKIFDVFQRLHSEDDYPGTGIGLATVKKAVEMQGGSVWVDSVAGEGSTFFVRFPQGGTG